MATRKQQTRTIITACSYCKEKTAPDFMNIGDLSKYVSERGKIFPRSRTALCAKHQRKVTDAVKRARYLALLPFTVRPE